MPEPIQNMEEKFGDASNFFQTDDSLAKEKSREEKRKRVKSEFGEPWVQAKSQVLFIAADNSQPQSYGGGSDQPQKAAFIAQSGFVFQRLLLENPKKKAGISFRGHDGPVTSVVCFPATTSSESAWLYSGSWDKTVRRWDIATGECLQVIAGHSDFIKSLAVQSYSRHNAPKVFEAFSKSDDQNQDIVLMFSGSSDKFIKIWNARTGECLRKLEGHRRAVECIVAPPASNVIYSSSSDGTIKQWDIISGECVGLFDEHDTSVYRIQLSVDETELWSASADGTIRKWDLHSRKCSQVFSHGESLRTFVQFDRYLITGCRDELIRVWDVIEDQLMTTVDAHAAEVSCMEIVGSWLLTGSYDATVWKWNIKDLLSKKPQVVKKVEDRQKTVLSAEEEAELAELMDI